MSNIGKDTGSVFSLEELQSFRHPEGIAYAVVGHSLGVGLISDVWIGAFERQENFKQVLEYIIEKIQTGRYHLWLADLRFMSGSFSESQHWLVHDLMPRAFDAGLEREAVVLPRSSNALPEGFDVYGSASGVIQQMTSGQVRGFHDAATAREWLLTGVISPKA